MAQLVLTVGFIALFMFEESCKIAVQQNPGCILAAFMLTIICLGVMTCFEDMRRKTPHNFIFLFVFTCSEGFLLGVISSSYKADTVLLAVGITAIVCFALTMFAFQVRFFISHLYIL